MAAATETETAVEACERCGDHPALGKSGKYQMATLCIECALDLRNEGVCPCCRASIPEGPAHITACKGKPPKERAKAKPESKPKAETETSLDEDAKVAEAQARLDARRAKRDAPVKNIRDMTLEELSDRLSNKWIELRKRTAPSAKGERVTVKSVTALDGHNVDITTDKGAVRTIDRTLITKIQR